MELLILGSLLMFGGVFAAFDLLGNDDDATDPSEPDIRHGGAGSDSMTGQAGETIAGWGGDDDLSLTGDASAYGNQGNDTIEAEDQSPSYGGAGNDSMYGGDSAEGYGGGGNDEMETTGGAQMWGGTGDDSIVVSSYTVSAGNMPSVYGDAGNDRIVVDAGHGYGGDGNDLMIGTGFEDLPVYANLGTTLSGGAGDDVILGYNNAQIAGDAGNDTLVLAEGAIGSGGDGNDTLILNAGGLAVTASGDAGRDVFAIEGNSGPTATDPTVIADFLPGEDRLQVDATGGADGSYLYNRATVAVNTALGYTDVTRYWQSQTDPTAETSSVLRLQGFDPAQIDILSDVQDNISLFAPTAPVIGVPLQSINGGPGDDALIDQRDVLLTTGAGNDSVTSAADGTVIASLGDGDDSFTATGAAHQVYGGAGDDHYLAAAPAGFADAPFAPVFYGGDGSDHIVVQDDGPTVAQSGHAPEYRGGAGNDYLEAQAGTGPLELYGGDGNDVLIGRAGQTFDMPSIADSAEGADDITITLTAAELTANGPARVGFGTTDHLTLNIDADLQGPITMFYHTAGNGVEVVRTDILVGASVVAVVTEGIPLIYEAIALNDPRLTVNRP
jgi:Ca2+-binding RTX toxin-like protein